MSKRNLVISVLGSALLIQAGYNNEVFGTESQAFQKTTPQVLLISDLTLSTVLQVLENMKNLNLQKVMSQTSYSNI